MTDQQRFRDVLQAAVPDAPPTRLWSGESRALARRLRRRRMVQGVAALAVVAAAVPVVRSLTASHPPQPLDITTHGAGPEACHGLEHHDGLGYLVDARVVDHALAVAWVDQLKQLPGSSTTVCAFDGKHGATVVATAPGARPLVVAHGGYQTMAAAMERLGSLQEGQPATVTQTPFTCPHVTDDNAALPGSATLPLGAIGARICDSIVGGPTQILTSGVDDLVRAINAQPLTYSRGSSCSGAGSSGYTLVLDYPTGTRVVAGDSCGWFGVGPVQRRELSPTVGQRFLSALRTQEEAKPATEPTPCNGRGSRPQGPGDITRIVAARFCPPGASGAGLLLSPQQLSRLTRSTDHYEEWSSNPPEPDHACVPPPAGAPRLMFSDAWHQQFSATLRCRSLVYWYFRFTDSGAHAVRPVRMSGVRPLLRELVHQAAG